MEDPEEFFKGKRVLVVGLGVFGGGVSTANFVSQYAKQVIITDVKKESELKDSMKQIKKRKNVFFVLGRHTIQDFKRSDIIIVNPGVPKENKFLEIAKKEGKQFENVASLFFRFSKYPTIAVTGTRGKSTTTSFISQLLNKKYGRVIPAGSIEHSLLEELSLDKTKENIPSILELSSWQLELLPASKGAPDVAVVTNVYKDHLNRYVDIKEYVNAKANIFKYQNTEDALILNYDNEWTSFFISKKPKARLFFISKKKLPKTKNGMFLDGDFVWFQYEKNVRRIVNAKLFSEKYGEHNACNLLTAILSVLIFDPSVRISTRSIMSLKGVKFRQEIIINRKMLQVINDSTSTSPDATIQAINRFGTSGLILICGGTDKNLLYVDLAKHIKKYIKPENLVLLAGSATEKIIKELNKISYLKKSKSLVFDTLIECVDEAGRIKIKGKKVIVFSPAGASFEKFKNEFDRGEQFNKLVQKAFK